MVRTIRPLYRSDPGLERVAKANGFSLRAGVSCEGHQKDKRERPGGVPLCRYIARPAVAIPRLSLNSTGKVVYTLKTPYRDGTTQVAFDGVAIRTVDFIARLAALARARSGQNRVSTSPANQGATCHAVSFNREENRVFTVQSGGTPVKNPWHGLLRALVQEWTDMNCAITSANNFSGQSAVI